MKMTEEAILAQHHGKLPVLITEVTRMSRGRYCVAGWSILEKRMVRPLQANGDNWQLGADRSVFAVGHVVHCRPTGQSNPVKPHGAEDYPLQSAPILLETLTEAESHELILPTSAPSIAAGIGTVLIDNKYVEERTDCRSLAGIALERRRLTFQESYGRLRLDVTDSDGRHYDLGVTSDHLQHMFDPSTTEGEHHLGVAEANQWLEVNAPSDQVILRVGLARPWDGRDKGWHPLRCYLQANGLICPQDNYHIF